jgi:hypothetical protein
MRKMSTSNAKGKKSQPKIKLGIPDLENSKAAVLRSRLRLSSLSFSVPLEQCSGASIRVAGQVRI